MQLFHLHTKNKSDEELMAQVKGGSDSAFDELYRRYARRLNGFFFCQLGGDEERAADAVQDVMLRLYEARGRYRCLPWPTTSARINTAIWSTSRTIWPSLMRNR